VTAADASCSLPKGRQLPDDLDVVLGDQIVAGDHKAAFGASLSDQQAVEGVTMFHRKELDGTKVLRLIGSCSMRDLGT
jgi:hypothetical protein